jgi:hypothetical protein
MDVFAPGHKKCCAFVVRNVSRQYKTIHIFHYPINLGCTRDLLAIPGVAEDDIRASLLKGEIKHKFDCKDIELVYSDIDLLQFSECNRNWLISLGFTIGVQVGYDELDGYVQSLFQTSGGIRYLWREEKNLIGICDCTNRVFNTVEKFLNGTYVTGDQFHIHIKHNGKDLYEGIDYLISESGGTGTGYDTITLISFTPNKHSVLKCTYAVPVP